MLYTSKFEHRPIAINGHALPHPTPLLPRKVFEFSGSSETTLGGKMTDFHMHEYLFFLPIVPYNTGFSFPHWPSQVRVVRLIVFTLRTNFGRKTRKIRRFFCIACSHLATFNMLHITCQHMCYVPYIGIRSNANWRPWWVRGKEVWLKPVTPGWMSPRKQWLPPGFMQWLLSRPEENMLSMHYFGIIGSDQNVHSAKIVQHYITQSPGSD